MLLIKNANAFQTSYFSIGLVKSRIISLIATKMEKTEIFLHIKMYILLVLLLKYLVRVTQ